jgi:hypothetical protein
VYDARNTAFDFRKDLAAFSDQLPSYEGELPYRSLVTVMYTANTYRKKSTNDRQYLADRQLSLNIQAVILLGTMAMSV